MFCNYCGLWLPPLPPKCPDCVGLFRGRGEIVSRDDSEYSSDDDASDSNSYSSDEYYSSDSSSYSTSSSYSSGHDGGSIVGIALLVAGLIGLIALVVPWKNISGTVRPFPDTYFGQIGFDGAATFKADPKKGIVWVHVPKIITQYSDGRSGSLKIVVYATDSFYTGGTISGPILGSYSLDPLKGGIYYLESEYQNEYSKNDLNLEAEKPYHITLALLEYSGDGSYIVSWRNSSETIILEKKPWWKFWNSEPKTAPPPLTCLSHEQLAQMYGCSPHQPNGINLPIWGPLDARETANEFRRRGCGSSESDFANIMCGVQPREISCLKSDPNRTAISVQSKCGEITVKLFDDNGNLEDARQYRVQ
jgi:hypothetical protein